MLLLAMRHDGGKRSIRRDVAVLLGGFCACWSAGTRDSAMTDALASVAEPFELDGMMVIKEKVVMMETTEQDWRAGNY